ncbi:hypothetical protein AJ79_04499 [Helicocarpus griseus UAMH5409]|uniref:Uncharacterized protein n=1 Tax=Helicocarpus griseus UAMH5409 TaxID=1447875 RepID=A0A2B7XSY8_9EURO|nr:hypothetical protein AJ79_04499 [Helicocarpus griseus UAMH5409]
MDFEIVQDLYKAIMQYGPIECHENEEARSRLSCRRSLNKIIELFSTAVTNKPEGLLESEVTQKGRIEHHFVALHSISVVFIEVKQVLTVGRELLDAKAQFLSRTCDYANAKRGYWVPILAILCDGNNFIFFVYDSVDRVVHTSGWVRGIMCDTLGDKTDLLLSLKRTSEYLFDFFIMAYVNALRAFEERSSQRSKLTNKKRLSTEKWEQSLPAAENARWVLREAAVFANNRKYLAAEELAERGVALLRKSLAALSPEALYPEYQDLLSLWDGSECLEVAFKGTNPLI